MLYMNAAGLAAIGLGPPRTSAGKNAIRRCTGWRPLVPSASILCCTKTAGILGNTTTGLLGRRYHLRGKRISWAGKPAHIELAVDISDGRYLNQRLADKTDTVNILRSASIP